MVEDIKKLQNGSDIRGIACEGVAGEHVNLTEDAGNLIGGAFAKSREKYRRTQNWDWP